jgi:hypothetical protein
MFGEKLQLILLGSTAWGILFLGNVLGLFPLFSEVRNDDNRVHDAQARV